MIAHGVPRRRLILKTQYLLKHLGILPVSDFCFPLSLQIKSDGQRSSGLKNISQWKEQRNQLLDILQAHKQWRIKDFLAFSEIQWIKTKWCNKNPTGTSNSVVPGSPNPLSHSWAAPGFIFARGESLESWKHYVYPAFLWVSPLSLLTPWAIKSLESNLLVISNLFMGRFDK